MSRSKSFLLAGAAALLVGVSYTAIAFAQALTPRTMPHPMLPALFLTQPIPDDVPNADQLRRGQYLVRVGDCASCHTPDGGEPLAGSYGLKTPFGTIYSTNLTSDAETGVGRMSGEAFYAALHHGVGPKGG